MSKPFRIFGVDPGTHFMGYGIVESAGREMRFVDAGVIRAGKKSDPIAHRLAQVQEGLTRLLAQYRPDILVLEQAFFSKNIEASIRLGEGRGVVLACAGLAKIPVAEYPPATVKKAVVGHGTADKSQVAAMIQALLHLQTPPQPVDATDALALAVCHGHREAF